MGMAAGIVDVIDCCSELDHGVLVVGYGEVRDSMLPYVVIFECEWEVEVD